MDQYRKSPRATWIEYNEGIYFVTLCTRQRRHYFGEISNGKMNLSRIGELVYTELEKASQWHAHIEIAQYVIMPNHIHAIIVIDTPTHQRCVPTSAERVERRLQTRVRPLLSSYIGLMKSSVTKSARKIDPSFGWQSRYHDHVIRDTHDGNLISEYIENNVLKWDMDCFNEANG